MKYVVAGFWHKTPEGMSTNFWTKSAKGWRWLGSLKLLLMWPLLAGWGITKPYMVISPYTMHIKDLYAFTILKFDHESVFVRNGLAGFAHILKHSPRSSVPCTGLYRCIWAPGCRGHPGPQFPPCSSSHPRAHAPHTELLSKSHQVKHTVLICL